MTQKFDIIIIGGGPAGLCFAAAIANFGLQVVVVEAPRYTSYPSALYFESKTSDTHLQWLQQFDLNQSVALYIHVPWLKKHQRLIHETDLPDTQTKGNLFCI